MKRIFPAPLLSVFLLVLWLLINRSASAGHLILGALFGLLIPILTQSLRPAGSRVRHQQHLQSH